MILKGKGEEADSVVREGACLYAQLVVQHILHLRPLCNDRLNTISSAVIFQDPASYSSHPFKFYLHNFNLVCMNRIEKMQIQ